MLEISDVNVIEDKNNLYRVRINIGGHMFFDSPPLPKHGADAVKNNLDNRTEPDENNSMYDNEL